MLKYYSEANLRELREAKSYAELLFVAIEILQTMREESFSRPLAMVCGPISTGGKGSRQANLEIFSRAIDRLLADGLFVFSQMPFENDMERIYNSSPELQGLRLLEEFYLPIFEMRFINLMCFLPGWEKSVGASWEHEQAERLGIPIIYLAQSYIDD
ncbi:MAG: DUF4406 domain-containing protein [Candidatus Yanofskybacteria bacterium]|nr:DUF4406 domain-containing protein [Candidatus Yanofskybacteria bacterium]